MKARRRAVRACDASPFGVVALWALAVVGGAFPPPLDGPPRCSAWLVALSSTLAAVLAVRRWLDPVTPLREVPLVAAAGELADRRWLASPRIVAVAFVVGAGALAGGAVARYRGFATPASELASFENALWNLIQGKLAPSSFLASRGLTAPFAPLLAILAAPYALAPRGETLLVIQAIAVASSVFPLARLARRELANPALAHALVVALAAYLPLRAVARADFQPALLAAPLVLEFFASLREGRTRRAAWVWAGALVCHPAVTPAALALGLYAGSGRRHRRLGAALVAIAAGWGAGLAFLARWEGLAASWLTGEGLGHSLHGSVDPGFGAVVIGWVALAPLAFLPLFAPAHMSLALPSLALAMAGAARAGESAAHLAVAAPLLLVAATSGARTLIARDDLRTLVAFYPTVAELERYLVGLLVIAAGGFLCWSPVAEFRLARASGRDDREAFLAALPPGVAVSAQPNLAAHLARRDSVERFPDGLAPWIVVDGGRWSGPAGHVEGLRSFERLRSATGCRMDARTGALERYYCDAGALRALAGRTED